MSLNPKGPVAYPKSFLARHIFEYSMHGKSTRDGKLIWSLTGELCGDPDGDRRHFEKALAMIRDLEEVATSDEKAAP